MAWWLPNAKILLSSNVGMACKEFSDVVARAARHGWMIVHPLRFLKRRRLDHRSLDTQAILQPPVAYDKYSFLLTVEARGGTHGRCAIAGAIPP
jgi:hypothetical protein